MISTGGAVDPAFDFSSCVQISVASNEYMSSCFQISVASKGYMSSCSVYPGGMSVLKPTRSWLKDEDSDC